jgi:hypothetical protein
MTRPSVEPGLHRLLVFVGTAVVGLIGGTVVALIWHSLWSLLGGAGIVAATMTAGLVWAASIPQGPPGRHRARRW